MRKSSFWTFVFSLMPGAGHMYLGYMNKGLQLILLFCALFALAFLLQLNAFLFLLPAVWCYSVFDCMHLRRKVNTPGYAIEDDYLIKDWKSFSVSYRLLGWAAIFLGVLILLANIIPDFLYQLDLMFSYRFYFSRFFSSFRDLFIAIVIIVIGVKLLQGKWIPTDKRRTQSSESDQQNQTEEQQMENKPDNPAALLPAAEVSSHPENGEEDAP